MIRYNKPENKKQNEVEDEKKVLGYCSCFICDIG